MFFSFSKRARSTRKQRNQMLPSRYVPEHNLVNSCTSVLGLYMRLYMGPRGTLQGHATPAVVS